MNMKKIVFSTFVVVGLIFIVVGAIVCLKVFDYSNTAETTAIITDIETYYEYVGGDRRVHHKTYLSYEVDGHSYTCVSQMYSSAWNIGDEIEVYYDIDNPQSVRSKDTDLALLVIPCLGVLFFCWGSIVLIVSRKK